MIVDRDGGRSPGELRGEKAVGRVETRLRRLGLAIFKEADGERRVAHNVNIANLLRLLRH